MEKKYGFYQYFLYNLSLKLLTKELVVDDIANYLKIKFDLNDEQIKNFRQDFFSLDVIKKIIGSTEKQKDVLKTESEEDEKEIEEIKKEIPEIKQKISYDQAIKNVINETKLSFEDKILEKRFKNIALSYLKDIRDEILTKENLMRSKKIGGMEYNEELANKIITSLKTQKPQIKVEKPEEIKKPDLAEGLLTPKEMVEEEKISAPIPQKPPVMPIEKEKKEIPEIPKQTAARQRAPEISGGEMKKEIPEKVEIPQEPKIVKKEEKSPEKEVSELTKRKFEKGALNPPIELPQEKLGAEKIETTSTPSIPTASKKAEEKVEEPLIIHRPSEPSVKPKIEEVKVTPKVYGPIDELRNITLEDWRRYGNNKVAASRIKDKIDLLEDESITKRAEGIKAWKNSEVNKLYLEISSEAINQGKTISEIIAQRQRENKPFLTIEEFNTIADLNQELRF